MERKASCHVADVFLTTLKLALARSSLKISKRSKKCIFGKKPRARARAPGVNKLTKQNTLHAQIMKCKLQGKTKKNERGI